VCGGHKKEFLNMKNLLKFLGIIAIVAIVGFTLASCGGSSSPVVEPETPVEPPPPVVVQPPDTSVWEPKIPATDEVNGILERTDDGSGDLIVMFAQGSGFLTYTISGTAPNRIATVTGHIYDMDDPTEASVAISLSAIIIPAYYLDPASPKEDEDDPTSPIIRYNYVKVTAIGDEAFTDLIGVASLKILPVDTSAYITKEENRVYNLETIGDKVFSGAANTFTTFALPEGVKTIGEEAFKGTTIAGLKIPSTVTDIGASAFEAAVLTGTLSFATDSALKTIGEKAFLLTSSSSPIISLPATVTAIGDEAFAFAYAGVFMLNGAGITDMGEKVFDTFNATFMLSGLGKGLDGLKAADKKWGFAFTKTPGANPGDPDTFAIDKDWLCTDRTTSAPTGTYIFDNDPIDNISSPSDFDYYTLP
jgi:hypothetical protein